MAALATIEDLEAVMGRTLTGDATREARVGRVLDMASAVVRRYTGQVFETVEDDTVTITPDGNGRWILPQRPVTAVTSIINDLGDTITDASFTETGEIRLNLLTADPFVTEITRTGWAALTVTYTHGYDQIPDDVIGVVCSIAARQIDNPSRLDNETVGDYRVGYGSAAGLNLTDDEKKTLRPFGRSTRTFRLTPSTVP